MLVRVAYLHVAQLGTCLDFPSTQPRHLFYEYLAQTALNQLTLEITYLLTQNYHLCLFVSGRHYVQRLIA